jgi:hypothetical protein
MLADLRGSNPNAITSVAIAGCAPAPGESAMNFLPSLITPMEFGGGGLQDSSFLLHAGVQAVSSCLGCFFVFFAVLTLQGVLLKCFQRTCSRVYLSMCKARSLACSCSADFIFDFQGDMFCSIF